MPFINHLPHNPHNLPDWLWKAAKHHSNAYQTPQYHENEAYRLGVIDGRCGKSYGRLLEEDMENDRLRLCYWYGYAEGKRNV